MQKLTEYKPKQTTTTEPKWFLVDATNIRLGKLATNVAELMTGKKNVDNVDYQLSSNYVVIINSDKVSFHPSREKNKFYRRHSGFPGGFKEISFGDQMAKDSRKVIEKAISGMLPKNKLREDIMARIKIFKDGDHSHEAQQPITFDIK